MRERLAHAPELLDAPAHDPAELERSLEHVAEVNRWLGGYRAIQLALAPLLIEQRAYSLLDVGAGSADIPLAIDAWAARRKLDVRITAADLHPQMRALALRRTANHRRIRIAAADALCLPYADGTFDVTLLSLTLHHFEQPEQVQALREAARTARIAVIVNELERGWPNYIGARVLAHTRWRRNRLTRHDGPLSVLRAFRPDELAALAQAAGLRILSLQRRFFYRLVLTCAARG